MEDLTKSKLMTEFNVAMGRLKSLGFSVISFGKASNSDTISIGILPPPDDVKPYQLFASLHNYKLRPNDKTPSGYRAQFRDLPGIVVTWSTRTLH